MKKYLIYTIISVFILSVFNNCSPDARYEYDIDWPIPIIETVSSYNAELSTTLILTGNFDEVTKVYFGTVKGDNLKVASDEKSLTIDVPRTMNTLGSPIIVTNNFKQTYQTVDLFIPIIQYTKVTKVSDIQVGLTFSVEGINVDLINEINVNGETVPTISKDINKILISVAGIDLKAGMLVDVDFTSVAKNEIPVFKKVNVIYPFITYEEVIIWDFADETHSYIGEPTATVETGDVLGKQAKYFSLRAPGYGWDKATGNMSADEVPDVSSLVNPYLTFAVRTPVGSAGYFQMEDQDGRWRHFGYGFETGGEWIIISQPLGENWEGDGDFKLANFKPKLGFKAGNAGENQDLDIAFVKITEGKYDGSQVVGDMIGGSTKPSKIIVMDFEDVENWPDLVNNGETIASLDMVYPFYGDKYFTYTDDGTIGNWDAYWGQTISKDMSSVDLGVYDDAYLSIALNSIDVKQYITVRMYQYEEQLVMVKKFFPNTGGEWQTFQFSLFNEDMENWSDGSTDLGAHYKSLKRFNSSEPFDKIEIIVGRADANEVGISIDEMVITEGPRY